MHLSTLLWFWKWPEYLLKWCKGWYELREAKHKAREAEVRAERAKTDWFEEKCYQSLRELAEKERTEKGGGPRIPLEPTPGPGDDAAALRRAWLRYKREVEEIFSQNWRGR